MDKRPVLFLDSGIGGLPYCRHFHERNPGEQVVYAADRLHFPYGKRERAELVLILTALVERLIRSEDPKIAVLACNTATVSALDELRGRFPALPFVGTVPAIKPAALASKTKKIGVLGTARTIEEPYIRSLAAMYGENCELFGVAAPQLVEFVEHRLAAAGEDEKTEMVLKYLNRFRTAGVDVMVLGCTHFLFLLEEFRREASPDIGIFDSIEGISRRIGSLLDENGGKLRAAEQGSAEKQPPARNRLILTGPESPEASWQSRAACLGFSLSLLGEGASPERNESGAPS